MAAELLVLFCKTVERPAEEEAGLPKLAKSWTPSSDLIADPDNPLDDVFGVFPVILCWEVSTRMGGTSGGGGGTTRTRAARSPLCRQQAAIHDECWIMHRRGEGGSLGEFRHGLGAEEGTVFGLAARNCQ